MKRKFSSGGILLVIAVVLVVLGVVYWLRTDSYTGGTLADTAASLYNGNIRHMVTAIRPLMAASIPQATAYRYDQLQRLKQMDVHRSFNPNTNTWTTGNAIADYQTTLSYDANGNIKTLKRNGSSISGLAMDNMTYSYYAGTNVSTQ